LFVITLSAAPATGAFVNSRDAAAVDALFSKGAAAVIAAKDDAPRSKWPWGTMASKAEKPEDTPHTMADVLSDRHAAASKIWRPEQAKATAPAPPAVASKVNPPPVVSTNVLPVAAKGSAPFTSSLRKQGVDPDGGIAQAPRGHHGDSVDHSGQKTEKTPTGFGGEKEPKELFGVSKIWWAMAANVVALLAFIACIPCVLTIAKRRRVS